MIKRVLFILLTALLGAMTVRAVTPTLWRQSVGNEACAQWVDSVMNTLDRQARVAQLFMPVVSSQSDQGWPEKIDTWVKEQGIGGLFFSQGTVERQRQALNRAQAAARVPLLIGADAEWGLAMRLTDAPRFPRNTMLAAITDTALLYEYGLEMARQCRAMGIQVNFAPDADVNNNPANPVINTRSFGSSPRRTATMASQFARGLEAGGVMAVVKHFPGHGNTMEDSHEQLARIRGDRSSMDSIELYPFRRLVAEGVSGVMVGHLSVPAYESNPLLPSSQSAAIVDGLLHKTLGFEGLTFTDALVMKGAAASYSGLNCIRALQAGNDILLSPANLANDLRAVVSAVERGLISDSVIDAKCRKVLTYKYILGLSHLEPIETEGLAKRLHSPRTQALDGQLHLQAMTLLRNEKDFLPLRHLESQRTAVVILGDTLDNPFMQTLKLYQENLDSYAFAASAAPNRQELAARLARYDRLVVGVYANTARQSEWLNALSAVAPVAICTFTSPYTLSRLGKVLQTAPAVLCAYEASSLAQQAAAQAVFGGNAVNGTLPVPIGELYAYGHGLQTEKARLSYGLPEEVGMRSEVLARIDSIVEDALLREAFPGCQVLVAKNGKVVWNKAYGYVDVDRCVKVSPEHVYDLASVTKALVCTPAVMGLVERGMISLDNPVSMHLPALQQTDKRNLSYRQMLYHEARLSPFVPFYQHLVDMTSIPGGLFLTTRPDSVHTARFDESSWAPGHFSYDGSLVSVRAGDPYNLKVADRFYVHQSFRDSVVDIICQSALLKRTRYAYSDLGFILMGFAAESLYGQTLDQWAEKELFGPLGAWTTTYLPLRKFKAERIVPTALDTTLRHQLILGYPHDEAAAFLGGVSGNAGLFSNANDLAKFLQMMLDEGTYGRHRYFEPSTVRFFTSTRSRLSRRMLGYDANEPNQAKVQPVSPRASLHTYGHTGFTGTCFWVDPDAQLIYIFLSNRVHPDRTNTLLGRLDIRPKIQDVIYQSFQ